LETTPKFSAIRGKCNFRCGFNSETPSLTAAGKREFPGGFFPSSQKTFGRRELAGALAPAARWQQGIYWKDPQSGEGIAVGALSAARQRSSSPGILGSENSTGD
jgi:hypothetical protein